MIAMAPWLRAETAGFVLDTTASTGYAQSLSPITELASGFFLPMFSPDLIHDPGMAAEPGNC